MNSEFPYTFNSEACQACDGRCCRGSQGYVWISMEELEAMAAGRGMDVEAFSRDVRQADGRLALRERFVV